MISNWNLGDYIKTAFLDLQYALGLPNPSSDNGVEAINRAAGINENNNQTVTVSKSDVHHNASAKIVDATDAQERAKQFINNTWVEYVGDSIWIPSDILKNRTQKEISMMKRRPPDGSLKYYDDASWSICSNSYWMPIGLKEQAEKNWMDIDEYVNVHKNGGISNSTAVSKKHNMTSSSSGFDDIINASTEAFKAYQKDFIDKFDNAARNVSNILSNGNKKLEDDMVNSWRNLLKMVLQGEDISNSTSYKLLLGCGVTDTMFEQFLGRKSETKSIPETVNEPDYKDIDEELSEDKNQKKNTSSNKTSKPSFEVSRNDEKDDIPTTLTAAKKQSEKFKKKHSDTEKSESVTVEADRTPVGFYGVINPALDPAVGSSVMQSISDQTDMMFDMFNSGSIHTGGQDINIPLVIDRARHENDPKPDNGMPFETDGIPYNPDGSVDKNAIMFGYPSNGRYQVWERDTDGVYKIFRKSDVMYSNVNDDNHLEVSLYESDASRNIFDPSSLINTTAIEQPVVTESKNPAAGKKKESPAKPKDGEFRVDSVAKPELPKTDPYPSSDKVDIPVHVQVEPKPEKKVPDIVNNKIQNAEPIKVENRFDNSEVLGLADDRRDPIYYIQEIQKCANDNNIHLNMVVRTNESGKPNDHDLIYVYAYSGDSKDINKLKSFTIDTGCIIDHRPKMFADVIFNGGYENLPAYSVTTKIKDKKVFNRKLFDTFFKEGKGSLPERSMYNNNFYETNKLVSIITMPTEKMNTPARKECQSNLVKLYTSGCLGKVCSQSPGSRFMFKSYDKETGSFVLTNVGCPQFYGGKINPNIVPLEIIFDGTKDAEEGNVSVVPVSVPANTKAS